MWILLPATTCSCKLSREIHSKSPATICSCKLSRKIHPKPPATICSCKLSREIHPKSPATTCSCKLSRDSHPKSFMTTCSCKLSHNLHKHLNLFLQLTTLILSLCHTSSQFIHIHSATLSNSLFITSSIPALAYQTPTLIFAHHLVVIVPPSLFSLASNCYSVMQRMQYPPAFTQTFPKPLISSVQHPKQMNASQILTLGSKEPKFKKNSLTTPPNIASSFTQSQIPPQQPVHSLLFQVLIAPLSHRMLSANPSSPRHTKAPPNQVTLAS